MQLFYFPAAHCYV